MAKITAPEVQENATPDTQPDILGEIIDFTEPTPAGKYDATIAALVAAGDGKATRLTVPNDRVAIELRYFRNAANAAGKTAKEVLSAREVDGDNTKITLKLVPRYHKGANKTTEESDTVDTTPETNTDAEESAETPAE